MSSVEEDDFGYMQSQEVAPSSSSSSEEEDEAAPSQTQQSQEESREIGEKSGNSFGEEKEVDHGVTKSIEASECLPRLYPLMVGKLLGKLPTAKVDPTRERGPKTPPGTPCEDETPKVILEQQVLGGSEEKEKNEESPPKVVLERQVSEASVDTPDGGASNDRGGIGKGSTTSFAQLHYSDYTSLYPPGYGGAKEPTQDADDSAKTPLKRGASEPHQVVGPPQPQKSLLKPPSKLKSGSTTQSVLTKSPTGGMTYTSSALKQNQKKSSDPPNTRKLRN